MEIGKIVLSGTGQDLLATTTSARPTSARTEAGGGDRRLSPGRMPGSAREDTRGHPPGATPACSRPGPLGVRRPGPPDVAVFAGVAVLRVVAFSGRGLSSRRCLLGRLPSRPPPACAGSGRDASGRAGRRRAVLSSTGREEATGVRLLDVATSSGVPSAMTRPPRCRPRGQVDDPVGVLDDVEVVLDDDDGVALVDEALEHVEELADVLEVQTGRRLVEDVDRAAGGALLQLASRA